MKQASWGAFALACVLISSCSLIVGNESQQCTRDADCAKFVGARCAADGLCKQIGNGTGGAGGAVSCSDNQDCLALIGNQAFCQRSTSTCVDLSGTACDTVYGLFANPKSVVVGALVPGTYGANQSQGDAIKRALRGAVDGFNSAIGPGDHALAVVVCDADAVAAPGILLDEIASPVLFAAPTSSLVSEAQQHGAALISPLFDPSISYDAMRSIAARPDREALAAAQLIATDLVAVLNAAGETTPLVTLVTDTRLPFAQAMSEAIQAQLASNALITVSTIEVAEQSTPASVATPLLSVAPDIVVLLGDAWLFDVLTSVEAGWGSGRRPLYVLSDQLSLPRLYLDETYGVSTTDSLLRKRVLGLSMTDSVGRPSASDFVDRVSPSDPLCSQAAAAFDAMYLIGYAAALNRDVDPVSGKELVDALPMLATGVSSTNVGPNGVAHSIDLLTSNPPKAIRLEGVTATLSFVNQTTEPAIQVWCVDKTDSTISFVESGRVLASGSTTLSGELSATCQPAL